MPQKRSSSVTPQIKKRGRPQKGLLSEGPGDKRFRVKQYEIPSHATGNPHLRGKAAKAWISRMFSRNGCRLYTRSLSPNFTNHHARETFASKSSCRNINTNILLAVKCLQESCCPTLWSEHLREFGRGKASLHRTQVGVMRRSIPGMYMPTREQSKTYRRILGQPKPWPDDYVGHDLKFFLGKRGDAALLRYPRPFLNGPQMWHVIEINEA